MEHIKSVWGQRKDTEWSGGGYTYCPFCKMRFSWGAFFEVENFKFCPECGTSMVVPERDRT